jgi:adenosylcobinamide-GDP ribazoletransferase
VRRPLAAVGLAVTFLTIVPVRLRPPLPALGAAAPWFPVVGAAVGAVAGGIDYLLQPSLGPTVAAVLAVLVLVGITGALHQDGLADCADGLGVRGDRARRLAVMRDPTVGTFGVLALGLWLLLVTAAIAGFARDDAWAALVAAAAVGRWAALLHASGTAPARADGLGAAFTVRTVDVVAATLLTGLATLPVGVGVGIGAAVASLGAALLVAAVITAWSNARLGGRSGDTLGATVALTEAVAITLLLALT